MRILGPVFRNFLLTGLAFFAAAVVSLVTGDGDWFFITFIGLSLLHILVWKVFWKDREDAARREFFGLDEQL